MTSNEELKLRRTILETIADVIAYTYDDTMENIRQRTVEINKLIGEDLEKSLNDTNVVYKILAEKKYKYNPMGNGTIDEVIKVKDIKKFLNDTPDSRNLLERFRVWWNKNTPTDGLIYERDLDEFAESELGK